MNEEMKEINLYFDESGNLGMGMGRYFLICALEIQQQDVKSLEKRAGRVMNRFKIQHHMGKNMEVKGSKLNHDERILLIHSILYRGVSVRYIVLDIQNTTLILKKSDDKNACYNYLVQLIVKKVIEQYPHIKVIHMYLDNRSVKIGNRLSLQPYLYNKFVFENLEDKKIYQRIDFQIHYMESTCCYLIEWADILANSIYKKYHWHNEYYYNMIAKNIIYESKFPSHLFGKDG